MFRPTVYLLRPLTENAEDWIGDNVDPNAQRFAGGVAIGHRYVQDILDTIEIEGMESQFELTY